MLNCAELKEEKSGFPHGWVYVRKSKLFTGNLAETQSLGWRLCKKSPHRPPPGEKEGAQPPSGGCNSLRGEDGNHFGVFCVKLQQDMTDPFRREWQPLPELFLSGKKKKMKMKKIFFQREGFRK